MSENNEMTDQEALNRLMDNNSKISLENISLKKERDELAAKCYRLIAACNLAIDMMVANDCDLPKTFETIREAIAETPTASLAHVRAEAGFSGFVEGCLSESRREPLTWFERAESYAESIRQGALGGEQ